MPRKLYENSLQSKVLSNSESHTFHDGVEVEATDEFHKKSDNRRLIVTLIILHTSWKDLKLV